VKTEDELAAILAHEVAHVNHRDGAAPSSARVDPGGEPPGAQAAQKYGGAELNELSRSFRGPSRTRQNASGSAATVARRRAKRMKAP